MSNNSTPVGQASPSQVTNIFSLGENGQEIRLNRSWDDLSGKTRDHLSSKYAAILEPDSDGSDISLIIRAYWFNTAHLKKVIEVAGDDGVYVPLTLPDHDSGGGLWLCQKKRGAFGLYLRDPRFENTWRIEETFHDGGTFEVDDEGLVLRCWFPSTDHFVAVLGQRPAFLVPYGYQLSKDIT